MNDHTPFGPPLDYPERARFVRPVDQLMLHRIMDRRPNLYDRFAANDRYTPRPDPALGGKFGLAVMVLVAALIGVLLATGGVL